MTQAVRKLSNKLASFINTRKPIVNVDRHLANCKNNSLLQELTWGQSRTWIPIGKQDTSLLSWFHHTACNVTQTHKSITTRIDVFTKSSPRAATKSDCSFLLSNGLMCNVNLLHRNVRASHINERSVAKYSTLSAPGNSIKPEDDSNGLPSQDQLQAIADSLEKDLPKLYVKNINYTIFSQDVTVIDRTNGKTTKGIHNLVIRMILMRITGHIKYAYVRFCILKMTTHPEDATVRIHWRIKGLTTLTVVFNCWKLKPWDITNSLEKVEDLYKWNDGLYTFYVGKDGKIHTCIIDNVIPNNEEKQKTPLKEKVSAKLSAQVPRPTTGASVTESK